jgi:iron(III) transport system permease protein
MFFRVALPTHPPALFATAVIVFVLALGELGASLLLSPPGYSTVSVRIHTFMHAAPNRYTSALCLIAVLMSLIAGAIGVAAFIVHTRSWDRRRLGKV